MKLKRLITVCIISLVAALSNMVRGNQAPSLADSPFATLFKDPESLKVSFIACMPGPEVYELCGHEAIRVRNSNADLVWNYGLFDFTGPNFVYRFVRGETDYCVGVMPFEFFLEEYRQRGSKVIEQELNLTTEQKQRLLEKIAIESLPENRTYRYNYVKDNCATRPLERLEQSVAPLRVVYPDTIAYGTFRKEMAAMHRNYPWYQFGIDLVLGSGIDYRLSPREEMFAPVDLVGKLRRAHFSDDRPVVSAERVLYEGRGDVTLPPTPFWLTPLFWSLVVLALSIVVGIIDLRRGRPTRIAYCLYWLLEGTAGIVVWFLILFSTHEATSPNSLCWWLMPLVLIGCVTIWSSRLRLVTTVVAWYVLAASSLTLLLWPLQQQSGNIAIFPLLIAGVIFGTVFAVNSAKGSPVGKRRKSAGRKPRKPAKRKKK